jgi:hypothetical protein
MVEVITVMVVVAEVQVAIYQILNQWDLVLF